ncbi:MAG: hypothetical protein ACPGYM_08270 [Flavobacteriales bacterium]
MTPSNSVFLWAMGMGIALLTLAGCTKYDQDGALVQFRSPEKRILGTWESSSVTEVGTDADTNVTEFLTSNNLRLEAIFEKDGSVTFENLGEELFYDGNWAFNEDNSVLHLDLESLKPTGPFFLDADSVDRESALNEVLTYLQENDTLFFESGTFVDVTDDVLACANAMSQTGLVWTLVQGNGENGSLTIDGVQFFSGDVITAWVEAVINDSMSDWQDEEWVVDELDYDGIVSAIMVDYNAEVAYVNQKNPVISGLNDPNLLNALADNCGLNVEMYTGTPEDILSEDVLQYVNANNTFTVTVTYDEDLRRMDVYWQILELEQDDLQAYQFREYVEDVSVYDYSFLLRFEKK